MTLGRATMSVRWMIVLSLLPLAQAQTRETQVFDHGWLFQQSDSGNAQAEAFADGSWTKVELPHDWAIAGPFDGANPSGGAGAFAPAGIGWYRKHFVLPETDAKRRVFVEFDGVMANSDVWINGFHLGKRPNGYVSFRYELTEHVKFGAEGNVLAVKADNARQPASRFYEGAGIYRHVRLLVMNPVHVTQWSTFLSTTDVTPATATVHVETAVINQSDAAADVALRATITDPAGKVVAVGNLPPSSLGALQQETLKFTIKVKNPDRWDRDHPVLYRAVVEPMVAGKAVDADTVNFGIREFHFDPDTGFWLNGKNFKINGVALHADDSSMGMAVPTGAWEHRLLAMKALGANAIRTAHNPVAPDFLDLCDRLGLLVMDEMFDMWTVGKNPFDYHLVFRDWYLMDTRDTVLRDRNHPSVILWSAGNEIHDTPNAALAKEILGNLVKVFHQYDPTRPVTQALFRPNVSHDYDDGLADLLDVIGQNYRPNEIIAAHTQKPTRKIIGTENTHDRDQWLAVRDHAPYSGMFVWSGTDYLGESRHWPVISDSSGLDDRTDALKPDGMERQSWWLSTPVVHIVRRVAASAPAATDPGYEPGSPQSLALAKGAGAAAQAGGGGGGGESGIPRLSVYADWTPANTAPHDENVEVYSNCAEVELSLNGTSLGSKPINPEAGPRRWAVAYAAGELKAACKGAESAAETLKTAGKPAKLMLAVERGKLSASWDDVGFVRATVVDEQGTVVPYASMPLTFSASNGTILTTDNGDNADHSGFQKPTRNAFRGSAIAVVRGTSGDVTVTVSGAGLTNATATLHVGKEMTR